VSLAECGHNFSQNSGVRDSNLNIVMPSKYAVSGNNITRILLLTDRLYSRLADLNSENVIIKMLLPGKA